jgi:hypothetical protein
VKRKIEMIEVGLPMNGAYFQVGHAGVTRIEAFSHDFENSVFVAYHIYKGEHLHATWENVPVMITYFPA